MVQVIPQAPSLGELFGGGVSSGADAGSKMLLKNALSKQAGMTTYQSLSTKLRQQDQSRKIEGAITNELLKLADPLLETGLEAEDVPNLSSDIAKDIEKGTNPQIALAQSLSSYSSQKDLLEEMEFPKFKTKKSKENQESVINTLKTNKISNPDLINKKLKGLKYPHRSRQDILKGLKEVKDLTPELAQKFYDEANGDKAKAREDAKKAGYSF